MRIRNPNGSGTLQVTKGAYREIYAHLGWVPDVEPKKTPIPHANEEEENPHELHDEQPEDELELQDEDQEDREEDMEDDSESETPVFHVLINSRGERMKRSKIKTLGVDTTDDEIELVYLAMLPKIKKLQEFFE